MEDSAQHPVIEVRGLVKRFGPVTALDGLDLRVDRGEVHALLGPDGAGKTTALRVLLGLLRPDAGTVRVLAADPRRDAVELHRRIAWVPAGADLWPDLSGREVVDLLGVLRGGSDRRRRDQLFERFALDPTRPCRGYSPAERQQTALVAAMASEVELLLLDEPTALLDATADAEFRRAAVEERGRGRTVLLSGRPSAGLEWIADRVTLVRTGRAVESGAPARAESPPAGPLDDERLARLLHDLGVANDWHPGR
ncbi:ABC transporter ATP-binding protein [Pseudonocardia sp. RS010]|uniref:ABC transporter ATP-binding protein n=1 Tax=Pseudonocardia sp. RS010 TaxID=3385979 RepID=UPI0039A2ECD7